MRIRYTAEHGGRVVFNGPGRFRFVVETRGVLWRDAIPFVDGWFGSRWFDAAGAGVVSKRASRIVEARYPAADRKNCILTMNVDAFDGRVYSLPRVSHEVVLRAGRYAGEAVREELATDHR